jgi:hypothetical protein
MSIADSNPQSITRRSAINGQQSTLSSTHEDDHMAAAARDVFAAPGSTPACFRPESRDGLAPENPF